MKESHIGDYVVSDYGITEVMEVDRLGGYISRIVLPKEVFIEAYNKWILEADKEEQNAKI